MYMNRNAPGSGMASLMAMQGRMGDSELVHMNPMEVKMFDAMTPGGLTRNPATGAPEAFAWWLPIMGAALGGIAGGAKGGGFKNVLKGAAIGGLAGLGGAGFMGATGLGSTAAGGIGSAWGPFSGLQGLFSGAGAAGGTSSIAGPGIGGNILAGTQAATQSAVPLSTVPHTMGMFGGVPPQAAIANTALTNPFTQMAAVPTGTGIGFPPTTSPIAPTFSTPEALRATTQLANPPAQPSFLDKTIGGVKDWFSNLGGKDGLSSVGSPAKDVGKEAAKETWLQRNRLPVSLGVAGASLLANQQPEIAGIPSLPERSTPRGTGTAKVRGRERRDDEIKTTDVLLAEALGPGFDFTEEEEETSGTAAVAQGGLIALQGGGRYIEPGGVEHYSRYGTWGGPAPGSAAYQGRYGTWGQGQVMNQVTTPRISSPKVNPHLVDPIYEQDVRALGFGPELDAERIRQGVRGAGGGGGEPVEEETVESVVDITGRSPRTFTNPDTGGTGELTEQQIVDYMTGVTPGGLPNLLSTPFRGDVASEEEIASQFIGSARGGNVFEGQVHTTGDGMSDDRRFDIVESPKGGGMGFFKDTGTDAVIARDEYVWPADAVAMLGNGSSNAGADILDNTVKQIRQASVGHKHQVNQIDGKKELRKALTT